MSGSLRTLFASLFRRQRADDFILSVGSVLARAVSRNLAHAMGNGFEVQHAEIGLDKFLEEVGGQGSGWLAVFLGDTDQRALTFLAPDGALAAMNGPGGGAAQSPGQPPLKGPELLARLSDGCAGILAFRPAESEETAGGPAAGPADQAAARRAGRRLAVKPFHRFLKRHESSDMDELAWSSSGCQAIRLTVQRAAREGDEASRACEAVIWALVPAELAEDLRKCFEAEDARAAGIRSLVVARETPAVEGSLPSLVAIRSPRLFHFAALFLGERASCAKQAIDPLPTSIEVGTGAQGIGVPGVWVRATVAVGSSRHSFHYFFPARDEARAARGQEAAKGLAACLLRRAQKRLAETLGARTYKAGVAIDSVPERGRPTTGLVISAVVNFGQSRVPCEVHIGSQLLGAVLRAACGHDELGASAHHRGSLPSLVFSADCSLLRRWVSTLGGTAWSVGSPNGLLPFAGIMDLVPDRDLAILLQNIVLPALRGRSLRMLFTSVESVARQDGQQVPRAVFPYPVDEARLLRFLPGPVRQSWETERELAAGGGTLEEYHELNREILAGILRGLDRGAFLLSRRARMVLERAVSPMLRARDREELARLISEGVPFAAIEKLPRPAIQGLLARQPDRTICLCLIGEEGRERFIRGYINRARTVRLAEELAIVRRLRAEGLAHENEAVRARLDVEAAARRTFEALQKEKRRP